MGFLLCYSLAQAPEFSAILLEQRRKTRSSADLLIAGSVHAVRAARTGPLGQD